MLEVKVTALSLDEYLQVILSCVGYRASRWRTAAFWLLVVLSCGCFRLCVALFPQLRKVLLTKCAIPQAQYVQVQVCLSSRPEPAQTVLYPDDLNAECLAAGGWSQEVSASAHSSGGGFTRMGSGMGSGNHCSQHCLQHEIHAGMLKCCSSAPQLMQQPRIALAQAAQRPLTVQ